MCDCRLGQRTSADGSVITKATAEVSVEIGLMVNIETSVKDGIFDKEEVKELVREQIEDLFDIDYRDKVLTDICIHNIQ